MCGRFTLRAPASVLAEQFALFELPPFRPRFNIAPTQAIGAVRVTQGGQREWAWLRWGLVPSWAKDPAIGNRMINARCETIAEKPAYRTALRRRRCLVAADGFYEWQKTGSRKQPYFIHFADDRPFAFAGLWENWEGPEHAALETCTLVTTTANEVVAPVHDRMPVILAPEDYALWLDAAVEDARALVPLLRPYPREGLVAQAVSTRVNAPTFDDAQCVEPV